MRAATPVIGNKLHTIGRMLRKRVLNHRAPKRLALIACVMAAAIPALVAFTRDVDAAATTPTAETQLAVATPAVVGTPVLSPDAAHCASMLVVGTLLIGAASAIRRAA